MRRSGRVKKKVKRYEEEEEDQEDEVSEPARQSSPHGSKEEQHSNPPLEEKKTKRIRYLCKVPGCDRLRRQKGLCARHFNRGEDAEVLTKKPLKKSTRSSSNALSTHSDSQEANVIVIENDVQPNEETNAEEPQAKVTNNRTSNTKRRASTIALQQGQLEYKEESKDTSEDSKVEEEKSRNGNSGSDTEHEETRRSKRPKQGSENGKDDKQWNGKQDNSEEEEEEEEVSEQEEEALQSTEETGEKIDQEQQKKRRRTTAASASSTKRRRKSSNVSGRARKGSSAPKKQAKQESSTGNKSTASTSLEEAVEMIRNDPLRQSLQPCRPKDHSSGTDNCSRNPNCLFGLGEKKRGIWAEKPWILTTFGPEPLSSARETGQEGKPAGLKNLGATCYINALLQTLFSSPAVRSLIYAWSPSGNTQSSSDKNVDSDDVELEHRGKKIERDDEAIMEMRRVFGHLQEGRQPSHDLRRFTGLLSIQTGVQQDAQEFNKLLLSYIDRVVDKHENKSLKNLMLLFEGKQEYVTQCCKCNRDSRRAANFYELDLQIKTLNCVEDSVEAYGAVERLDGHNKFFCSECKEKNDAKRFTQLVSLPDILNLQLIRFVYDATTSSKKKLKDSISIPTSLDFSSDQLRKILAPAAQEEVDRALQANDQNKLSAYRYKLTAVLNHKGQSANSGHYTADVFDRFREMWFSFDDENVQKIEKNEARFSSRNAYMLVYEKERYSIVESAGSIEFPISLPPDLAAEVQETNRCLEAEAESYEEAKQNVMATIEKRKKQYQDIFKNQKKPAFVDKRDEGYWVPKEWLKKWILGFPAPGDVDDTAKLPVFVDVTDQPDVSNISHTTDNVPTNNNNSTPSSSSQLINLVDEDDDDLPDSKRPAPPPRPQDKDRKGTFASQQRQIFAELPDYATLLCPHNAQIPERFLLDPNSISRLKRVSKHVWYSLLETCGVEDPKNVQAIPCSHTQGCLECLKRLTNEISQAGADEKNRFEIEARLAKDFPSLGSILDKDKAKYAYIAKSWVSKWRKLHQKQQTEAQALIEGVLYGKFRNGKKAKDKQSSIGNWIVSASDPLSPGENINESITCSHGGLSVGSQGKRAILLEDFDFVREYALGGACKAASKTFLMDDAFCEQCIQESQVTFEQRKTVREGKRLQLADKEHGSTLKALLKRKSGHPKLTNSQVLASGMYNIVPRSWMSQWRQYLNKTQDVATPPGPLHHAVVEQCTCHHTGIDGTRKAVVHPQTLNWLKRCDNFMARDLLPMSEKQEPNPHSEHVEILLEKEWNALLHFYPESEDKIPAGPSSLKLILHTDLDVKSSIPPENELNHFDFSPELCEECVRSKEDKFKKGMRVYAQSEITIVLLPEKDFVEVDQVSAPSPSSASVTTPGAVVGKRRSTRVRKSTNRKTTVVDVQSCSQLSQLIVKLLSEGFLPAYSSPSNLAAYHRGKLLTDLSARLEDIGVDAVDEVEFQVTTPQNVDQIDEDLNIAEWLSHFHSEQASRLDPQRPAAATATDQSASDNRSDLEVGFAGSVLAR